MAKKTKTPKPSFSMSIRISPERRAILKKYSDLMRRSAAYSASELMWENLEIKMWQHEAIQEALGESNDPATRGIPHEEVMAWIESLGSDNELAMPA